MPLEAEQSTGGPMITANHFACPGSHRHASEEDSPAGVSKTTFVVRLSVFILSIAMSGSVQPVAAVAPFQNSPAYPRAKWSAISIVYRSHSQGAFEESVSVAR